jgi:hypothetical protein
MTEETMIKAAKRVTFGRNIDAATLGNLQEQIVQFIEEARLLGAPFDAPVRVGRDTLVSNTGGFEDAHMDRMVSYAPVSFRIDTSWEPA